MVGRDNGYHRHLSAGAGRHASHVYAGLLRQGLLRAASRGTRASVPENELYGQRMVEVMERKDGITIIAELFGVHAEDLKVNLKSFKNGILVLNLDWDEFGDQGDLFAGELR
jgi:hypothetical protein